ncbi:hypothetical protein BDV26DRAFT_258155 [Aspergillus bertholletiae]|uniref:Uncharacterized protein n=1 Tax=Aspergillus bertholletiae TaxID=1226010 RepID=A0A5N7BE32_9EURO|nr:hypothetical protein BDV26DRAFT_258155 [Aspergillus bertholletiae]
MKLYHDVTIDHPFSKLATNATISSIIIGCQSVFLPQALGYISYILLNAVSDGLSLITNNLLC